MAQAHAEIATPWAAGRALEYVGNFEHLTEWDPSAVAVARVEGTGVSLGSVFDVTVRFAGRESVYRYTVTHSDERRVTLTARSGAMRLEDTVVVRPREGGSVVEYHADVSLQGAARLASPLLSIGFARLARNALQGLRSRLDAAA